jgi:hypothetical protein
MTRLSSEDSNPMQLEVLELLGSSQASMLILLSKLSQNLIDRQGDSIKHAVIVVFLNPSCCQDD